MAFLSRWLHVPRPRTFLYLMSLRTGAEMIALSMLFNKLTGFYGLLAILTGFQLNATQLSMYIYSLGALILLALLMPHIRKQSPLQCLALAWFYAFDTVINFAYTAAIGVTWFLTISASEGDSAGAVPGSAPGSDTINDTAGFTSPKFNVSVVDVVAVPASGIASGQDAVAYGVAAGTAATAGDPSIQHGLQLAESIPSIILIVVLNLIRIYFIFIMMAYARQVLRHYSQTRSTSQHLHMDGAADNMSPNPFAAASPHGQGWKGKLGRTLVFVGKDYWLGGIADDEWTKDINNRFAAPLMKPIEPPGNVERERRARSGTGPPKRPTAEAMLPKTQT